MLAALVRETMGAVYVFRAKQTDRIKLEFLLQFGLDTLRNLPDFEALEDTKWAEPTVVGTLAQGDTRPNACIDNLPGGDRVSEIAFPNSANRGLQLQLTR